VERGLKAATHTGELVGNVGN